MIRNIKTLWVAALAVLALSAIGASTAQATNFTASSYPTSFTAESVKGNDDFQTEAGAVECKSHFSGTISAASETITVNADYSECSAFGFASATVNMGSCDYVFHTNGVVDLTCGKTPASIVASTCEATFTTQSGLKSVSLKNGTGDITAQAGVTGIAYNVTKDGFGCPFNGTGAKTGASYKQNNAVTVQSTSKTTIDIG
jgi:hypothetical protein